MEAAGQPGYTHVVHVLPVLELVESLTTLLQVLLETRLVLALQLSEAGRWSASDTRTQTDRLGAYVQGLLSVLLVCGRGLVRVLGIVQRSGSLVLLLD